MIRYPVTRAQLEADITAKSATWLQRAADRTEEFRLKGYYEESSSIWSEVKPVYMKLQGNCKCAFCERKMTDVPLGTIEQDVEHFRPKGRVRPWPVPLSLAALGIPVSGVPAVGGGYYLLPYHLFNYAAACKPCNSQCKSDFFPIAGDYDLAGDDPEPLLAESPYLIYPIGDLDDDPEDLIGFHGVSPQAIGDTQHKRARALVTIELFELDHIERRKELLLERARIIVAIHPQLEVLADGGSPAAEAVAQMLVDGFTSARSSHTNCARSFRDLFVTDRAEADEVFAGAALLIASSS
jgi:hypothetical protein